MPLRHLATTAIQVAFLLGSGITDAKTSNALRVRCTESPGCRFTELNPALRPVVGTPGMYLAIAGADLGMYTVLRLTHKPRLAMAYSLGSTAIHVACSMNSIRQVQQPALSESGAGSPLFSSLTQRRK